jgi:hypothetical protein
MARPGHEGGGLTAAWRTKIDVTVVIAFLALGLSGLSFYRSYIYSKQQLEMTVTEVSYVTNLGELYMTVAFSNGGTRDAALLRIEPAIWGHRAKEEAQWIPLAGQVSSELPLTTPKMPAVVKAGGVEVVALSARLNAAEAEEPLVSSGGAAYLGIRVATMNSDGNLYLVQHPVARLSIDQDGRILSAEPAIHRSLSGFSDLDGAPPGDLLQANKKTPFVWADQHYR